MTVIRFALILAFVVTTALAERALAAEIHDAARSGDVERVRAILKVDASQKDAVDGQGATPLHVAKNAAVAQVLLDAAPTLGAKDKQGRTPIDAAAADGRLDVAAAIVDKLAKMSQGVLNLQRALSPTADAAVIAIQKRDLEGLTALVGKNPALVNEAAETQEKKYVPLHAAVIEKWVPGIDFLLDHGANVEARDTEFGGTALHEAASGGRVPVAAALLDHGANIDAQATSKKLTPLHLAVTGNDYEMVSYLLKRGANPDLKSDKGISALDIASNRDREDVRFLLEQRKTLGAKRFTDARNLLGAASRGDLAAIESIGGKERDLLNVRNNTLGLAPLHMAAMNGQPGAVTLLIKLGADPFAKSEAGDAPLDMAKDQATKDAFRTGGAYTDKDLDEFLSAAAHGDIAKLKQMLDRSPKLLNAQNKFLGSALHWAADAADLEATKFLVERGANTKLKDDVDRTPKETAKFRGDQAKKRKDQAMVEKYAEVVKALK